MHLLYVHHHNGLLCMWVCRYVFVVLCSIPVCVYQSVCVCYTTLYCTYTSVYAHIRMQYCTVYRSVYAVHSNVLLQMDVEEIAELSDLRDELMSHVSTVMNQSTDFQDSFDKYAYLWVDDRQVFMEQFLLYGHVLSPEEVEQAGDEGVPETPPTLNQFKEQVDAYEKVYVELEQVSSTAIFDKWFRVDVRPFRQALLNVVKRWSFMFKEHLITHVTSRYTRGHHAHVHSPWSRPLTMLTSTHHAHAHSPCSRPLTMLTSTHHAHIHSPCSHPLTMLTSTHHAWSRAHAQSGSCVIAILSCCVLLYTLQPE